MDVIDSYYRFSFIVYVFCERFKCEIYEEIGIYCIVGIGFNMLLSKIVMDVEVKYS